MITFHFTFLNKSFTARGGLGLAMDPSDIVYMDVDSIHSSKEISTQKAGELSQTFLSEEFVMEAEIQFVRLSVCMCNTGTILISLIRNLQRPTLQTA